MRGYEAKEAVPTCPHNDAVLCKYKEKPCALCGWNPLVAMSVHVSPHPELLTHFPPHPISLGCLKGWHSQYLCSHKGELIFPSFPPRMLGHVESPGTGSHRGERTFWLCLQEAWNSGDEDRDSAAASQLSFRNDPERQWDVLGLQRSMEPAAKAQTLPR